MNCSRNDVVLLPIPFTDLTSRKVRPAAIIGRNGSDLFLTSVSSVLANVSLRLQDWRSAGLNVASREKAQIATVEERLVVKIVSQISSNATKALNERLRSWLDL